MSQSDLEYFRMRAKQERELAADAANKDVAAAHIELAIGYEALVRGELLRLDHQTEASCRSASAESASTASRADQVR